MTSTVKNLLAMELKSNNRVPEQDLDNRRRLVKDNGIVSNELRKWIPTVESLSQKIGKVPLKNIQVRNSQIKQVHSYIMTPAVKMFRPASVNWKSTDRVNEPPLFLLSQWTNAFSAMNILSSLEGRHFFLVSSIHNIEDFF